MKIHLLLAFVCLAIGLNVPIFAQQQDTTAPPESEQAKQIVALVEQASTLIDSKGKSIFSEFRTTGTEWRTDDTYLFVDDLKGMVLFNGGFPDREGSNSSSLKDSNGKLFWAEFVKVVQSKGSGWVDYTVRRSPFGVWREVLIVRYQFEASFFGLASGGSVILGTTLRTPNAER